MGHISRIVSRIKRGHFSSACRLSIEPNTRTHWQYGNTWRATGHSITCAYHMCVDVLSEQLLCTAKRAGPYQTDRVALYNWFVIAFECVSVLVGARAEEDNGNE